MARTGGPDDAGTSQNCVVGRFAPTPSGRMHVGNAFSFLMAWLAARSTGGRVILRIEDLDPRARAAGRAAALMGDLDWLGLAWDDGPFFQSDRAELYDRAIATLSNAGLIYPCFCTRSELHAATAPHASDGAYVYQGTCRNLSAGEIERRAAHRAPALRLAVPDASDPAGVVTFNDAVWGAHREELAVDCGDFLVRRSDGIIAYQLAVVVDDGEMGVSQVVRGRDLLGSAARQIWLARQLGYRPPQFAHTPLLVSKDGRRLAKRDHDLDVGTLRKQGYDAQTLIGTLAHAVGLASSRERITADRLVSRFSWELLRACRHDIVVDDSFLP